ncbi:hypothetical protein M9458_034083, partial [Cirrhinus mrigala]
NQHLIPLQTNRISAPYEPFPIHLRVELPKPKPSLASRGGYRSFQDPTQKTYSGDVLLKHAHRFTQEKPFTPRTLKSDHKSTLLQYRYYTPPRRKAEQEESSSKIIRQETYHGRYNQ